MPGTGLQSKYPILMLVFNAKVIQSLLLNTMLLTITKHICFKNSHSGLQINNFLVVFFSIFE